MASDQEHTGDAPRPQDPQPESGPLSQPGPALSDPQTSIIRRHPTGEIPIVRDEPLTERASAHDEALTQKAPAQDEALTQKAPAQDEALTQKARTPDEALTQKAADHEPQTTIIRRHPTGAIPVVGDERLARGADNPDETQLAGQAEPQTGYIPRARPTAVSPTRTAPPSPRSAMAAAVFSILTGWPTAVIATNLIANWWRTDQLFCVAVGFLTAISAAALIAGLIGLLLRRWVSRLLIMVGAVVALLIFSSLFVAGAKLPPIVYAIPVLPVLAIVAAALPATGRWERSG